MGSGAGVDSVEAMMASMAALAVLEARSEGRSESTSPNPLRDQADACLEGLEVTARLEAMLAARKVRFTAGFADITRAMAAPDAEPQERTAQEMAIVSEVAC
ncbi:MAG TPA: endonuclease, partial [Arthrobacter sp.]|nr:endonuclease [Arthrobacter sp.]